MNVPARLYMAVNTTHADFDEDDPPAFAEVPEGWGEFSFARWGEVRPFFFPSTHRVYRSRSAAQARADLIRYWGGTAEVVECTPQWQTVADAKRDRQKRAIHARVMKLEDALAAERAKFAEVAS